ncbi:helix-turn-helix domain-containing protein [Marinobacter sp. SS21]|uniref:helix-turn-helix domain-containing protein n=1 Tax=Marinobacter sp. SS21 TaxID=2979460 RepID=UPI002330A2D3|nr:helix-turn-helix domain-containing protein [Marinobacter sp. SS21]MDC0663472.1 helix-turn-helix domain-containing protein [Marinobacter sp. SS21]
MTKRKGRTPFVHLQPGMLLVVGGALDADVHAHHAIQVVWPVERCEMTIDGQLETGPVIVASGVPHCLKMQQGLVILLEPQSDWGELLADTLAGHRCRVVEGLPALTELVESKGAIQRVLPRLAQVLGKASPQVSGDVSSTIGDDRIARLLSSLDACFMDHCLKPDHWRASEVATSLSLSEGRFLHLFREQMGIAWRPYLLWRRLLCAVNGMSKGMSATQAAHEAGFSDSAHLSRTFRSNFGMSIREAMAVFDR